MPCDFFAFSSLHILFTSFKFEFIEMHNENVDASTKIQLVNCVASACKIVRSNNESTVHDSITDFIESDKLNLKCQYG